MVHKPSAGGTGSAIERRAEGRRAMNTSPSRAWAAAGIAARWIVGGLYIWMGLRKAGDPVGFLKLLHQYNLTDVPLLLNLIAAALPWVEVTCGVLLVLGVAVRGTALVS